MNVSDLIMGNRTFVSVSVFEALVQACQVRDGTMNALTGELRDVPIFLKAGDVEIPLEQVMDQFNATAARSFDTAVAERVKEMIAGERFAAIKQRMDNIASDLDSFLSDFDGTVGRMIQAELGPNSTWHESSGTC